MKAKIFKLFLILLIITNCNNKPKNKSNEIQDISNQTPEVLDEKKDYGLGSFSKRYDSDIISKLYNEALDKNLKLQQLNDKIKKMSVINNDSLSEYHKFIRVNDNYRSSAIEFANRIQDSVLKASTLKFIESAESNYETTMYNHKQKQLMIDKKSNLLDDKLIIMKLMITESMISNYQKNENPDIKKLENIIKKYDSLINATEEYTKNIK